MSSHLNSKIYVVDDDESVGKALTRLLVLEGYDAETFSSARSFLDSVPSDAEGCMISDIYMPGVDGFALQQMMYKLGYKIPVIFMSAHAKAGDREHALERGAKGFLLKPFDQRTLLDLVQGVLGE